MWAAWATMSPSRCRRYAHLPEAGAEVRLRIHTHVREDALALYGFLTQDEKALFEKLISVSGIGPKMAMAVLSGIPALDLIANIRRGEVDRLVRIPGVGKKTAERMVLELRDKMPAPSASRCQPVPGAPSGALTAIEQDVLSALLNLGMRARRRRGRRAQSAQAARPTARYRFRAAFPARPGTGTVKRKRNARSGTCFRRAAARGCAVRSRTAAAQPRRLRRPEKAEGEPRHRHRGRPHARRGHGSRAALRPAGPGQNHARLHHRRRTAVPITRPPDPCCKRSWISPAF